MICTKLFLSEPGLKRGAPLITYSLSKITIVNNYSDFTFVSRCDVETKPPTNYSFRLSGVAKCHGYDGRVKIFAVWRKKFGRTHAFDKSSSFEKICISYERFKVA